LGRNVLLYRCMVKRKVKKQRVANYTAIFEPAEEGGYVVYIPALPGCATQGDTFEEAEIMAKEAIELYLETVSDLKQEIHIEPEKTIIS